MALCELPILKLQQFCKESWDSIDITLIALYNSVKIVTFDLQ